jgi:hypothetical protein
MEPGKDDAYRDQLPDHMVYQYGNSYHGGTAKRSIEGPQICTKAGRINVEVIRGKDFVAVRNTYRYTLAAPGHKPGSLWTQVMVFPAGKRYFVSMDRIDAVNDSEAMFLRIDMPGHIKHNKGDTFSEVYLSYAVAPPQGEAGQAAVARPGAIRDVGEGMVLPSSAFFGDFPPDGAFNYRRDTVAAVTGVPQRFIRAYRLFERAKDQPAAPDGQKRVTAGKPGPWLAGMTLDPSVVHEAWCHQRGYICMIEEFGGRPIKAGQSFSAAFIVGYFDSIDEMHAVYDEHKGHTGVVADEEGWRLTKP